MSLSKESGRLAWLAAAWGEQRARVIGLLSKLGGFGAIQGMKPHILRRFMCMLEQIADAKDEETRIISQIETIEQEHLFKRKTKCLPYAKPASESVSHDHDGDNQAPRPRSWLWAFAFLYASQRKAINQKKHGLTVD